MRREAVRKENVLTLMRRMGLADRVEEADEVLSDEIDLDRDAKLLERFGLEFDRAVDRLGGSAW